MFDKEQSGNYVATPDAATAYLSATFNGVSSKLGTTTHPWGQGNTFGICYCPAHQGCGSYTDFMQQVDAYYHVPSSLRHLTGWDTLTLDGQRLLTC
ncbi:hypothetical protein Pmar_PMAR025344 [Perkinsus marinus ATCC 50983]|uniref:Uncharacterized protein n=1 Tax=Perkinsus marinus (strain ATCC 50983 / TXsc) TaxID=423536 RepID=C5KS20_PERM5|nr:hypothetical protein Pmar_PMAR025344 [Perkinsus marinus ATCC 50983]EER12711.1 hypothetical protein Pmar_PMAR025344 [Perkinsus marinus ATCC 50983]|eukprot:XP_002780916.1 hypothetical protein Pmar_PMAR025344 [Perkinsus marinus ATCC 50983]